MLGSPELENRPFFKQCIIAHALYVREGIEPAFEFWDVAPAVRKPWHMKTREELKNEIPRGSPGNGYPSNPRQSAPKQPSPNGQ